MLKKIKNLQTRYLHSTNKWLMLLNGLPCIAIHFDPLYTAFLSFPKHMFYVFIGMGGAILIYHVFKHPKLNVQNFGLFASFVSFVAYAVRVNFL